MLNSCNAEATFVQNTRPNIFENQLNPVINADTHRKALAVYTQMSTHVPGFQSFFMYFASFCIGQISHQRHKG